MNPRPLLWFSVQAVSGLLFAACLNLDAEELAGLIKQSQNNDERLFEIALNLLLVRQGDSKFLEISDTLLRAHHCQWKIGQTIKFDAPIL